MVGIVNDDHVSRRVADELVADHHHGLAGGADRDLGAAALVADKNSPWSRV